MKKPSNQPKYHRLDSDKRYSIQHGLDNGDKVSHIAKEIGLPTSTVTREIERHLDVIKPKGNDCLYSKTCKEKFACIRQCGQKLCRRCSSVPCFKHCSNYTRAYCSRLEKAPHVCNGCSDVRSCRFEKQFYRSKAADDKAIKDSKGRKGDTLFSPQELKQIDELISPLIIKNKQSPNAALVAVRSELDFDLSLTTLYRLINSSKLTVRAIHLPEAVGRRRRRSSTKKKGADAYATMKVDKQGHMYADFEEYMKSHDIVHVEMDCVEGRKTDTAVILSLNWKKHHMQLYFMLDAHDASHVVEMLDIIEESLGFELFKECIPLILTDNGEEFTDIEGMERSITRPGEKRTMIFFCEPNRSYQKGSAERTHRLLRRIVKKRTSADDSRNMSVQNLTQADMTLVSNHVNSYPRPEFENVIPYELASKAMPEDFFILLGLEQIPQKEVILSPDLIYKTAS